MRFVLVNDRAAQESPPCAHCSTLLGFGYLKDMSSRQFYCDYTCYMSKTTKPFYFGAGFNGLFGGGVQHTTGLGFRTGEFGTPSVW